jgi:holo-[acyl-carrier protein] synthase
VSIRGVGVDVVHLPRLRAAIERWQSRFVERVFTEGEIAYCRARRDPIPHFGARFAAKEASLKALGTGLSLGVRWREIEVRRARGQAPELVLSGRSREIGEARGGTRMLVSLTHDGEYAIAHAVLVSEALAPGAAPGGSPSGREPSPSARAADARPGDR